MRPLAVRGPILKLHRLGVVHLSITPRTVPIDFYGFTESWDYFMIIFQLVVTIMEKEIIIPLSASNVLSVIGHTGE